MIKYFRIGVKFEPRDLWLGIYWNTARLGIMRSFTFYICIVPMLPIIIHWNWVDVHRWRENAKKFSEEIRKSDWPK